MRNERGQIDRASSDRATAQLEAEAEGDLPTTGSSFGKAATAAGQRGAFGQNAGGATPNNRADRRSQGKRK